jgi:xanthine dehydrogenase molybdopterin-binding subunit B
MMIYIFRIVLCAATAVAAVKVGRPVRLNMDRHIDMSVTGQRHSFKVDYCVGFTHEGRLSALDIRMWSNGGCTTDVSIFVMCMAMLHMGNCYQCSNVRIRGKVCKTHLPSNTGLLLKDHCNKFSRFLFD